MPIRPENRARYPADWPAIRQSVRDRSGNRCECDGRCGRDHGGRCAAVHGEPHPITASLVVLTVMHLDHCPEHNEPENLMHGCQQCHNAYDAPMRRAGVRDRLRLGMAAGDLFA